MSYILESLKKSDQERQSSTVAAAVAVSPEVMLLAPKPYSLIRMWRVIITVVIIVALIAIWFFVGKGRPDGYADTANIEAPFKSNDTATVLASHEAKSVDQPPVGTEKANPRPISTRVIPVAPVPEDVVADALYEQQVLLPDDEVLSLYQAPNGNQSLPSSEDVGDKPLDTVEPVVTQAQPLSTPEVAVEKIPEIYDLDRSTQRAIPAISYGAHIYATDKVSGFVILNGAKRKVGEKMRSGVYIEQVNEHDVVLSYQGLVFSLPAMKSWVP
jgi:hypothetical protein